ncbi:hypothetical protein NESM_000628300 [Novymonas esmeraldas]|uniref:Uncharacterized protein n=1 Tax=Novymonas esmeraldas TaxID=1808958 RepID=A0AAW0EUM6_9TRYP
MRVSSVGGGGGAAVVRTCAAALVLCLALLAMDGHCLTARRGGGRGAPRHALCAVEFADSYSVSIATTQPVNGRAPMTQVGQLYVDEAAGGVRIEHVYQGRRTSFLVDNHRLRAFFFFTEESGDDDEAVDSAPRQRCHVFHLPRRVAPFCVPRHYIRSPSESVVRGVAVARFTSVGRLERTPLVEQSFYVLTPSSSSSSALSSSAVPPTPWRLELRARPDLETRTLADLPHTPPNWRFFGHPMFDEVALSPAQETHLQTWEPAYDMLTLDFYDYYPTALAPEVFAVPPQCTAVLQADVRTGAGSGGEDGGDSAMAEPLLELANIHRFLVQWHALQNTSLDLVERQPK